jgi:hypothetical protein
MTLIVKATTVNSAVGIRRPPTVRTNRTKLGTRELETSKTATEVQLKEVSGFNRAEPPGDHLHNSNSMIRTGKGAAENV